MILTSMHPEKKSVHKQTTNKYTCGWMAVFVLKCNYVHMFLSEEPTYKDQQRQINSSLPMRMALHKQETSSSHHHHVSLLQAEYLKNFHHLPLPLPQGDQH
jgi:hypothetical protein